MPVAERPRRKHLPVAPAGVKQQAVLLEARGQQHDPARRCRSCPALVRAIVTTACFANGIRKRQTSTPSPATVIGSDVYEFQAGPVPKKSMSGVSTVVSPSNAIDSRVARSASGARSSVAIRSSASSPPPGGAGTVVTETWSGATVGGRDGDRARARQ